MGRKGSVGTVYWAEDGAFPIDTTFFIRPHGFPHIFVYLLLKRMRLPLMAAVTGVYDHVDQGSAFPYVVIGEDSAAEFDTDTEIGAESSITIHTWSRYKGRQETKEIQQMIYDILHRAELTITDAKFYGLDWQFSDSFLEPDGETRHGVMRFRLLYDSLPVS